MDRLVAVEGRRRAACGVRGLHGRERQSILTLLGPLLEVAERDLGFIHDGVSGSGQGPARWPSGHGEARSSRFGPELSVRVDSLTITVAEEGYGTRFGECTW